MSLKAKLEAVIYAAEEPVTLAQLAALFANEAFAWKALQAPTVEEPAATSNGESDGAHVLEFSDSTAELADLVTVAEEMEAASVKADSAVIPGEDELSNSEPAAAGVETNDTKNKADEKAGLELEARQREQKRNREAREILRGLLDELIAEYASDSRGIEIREIAGGFRMGTKPEIHDAVRSFVKSLKPALKLSLPALETLAVIAYKQPVTAPEVGEIRGVDSGGVLGSLMSRKLITTAGRKQVIGRPILYKTTKEFLLRFGLKDVNELPSMEEFEKIAAQELSDTEEEDSSGDAYADTPQESGDLFGSESSKNESSSGSEPGTPTTKPESRADIKTSIPTAAPSHEAAEAHALVERQNAEEVEAER